MVLQKHLILVVIALNVVLLFSQVLPVSAETIHYSYDEMRQLSKVEYSSGQIIEYEYDTVGNRTSMTISARNISGSGYNYPEPDFRANLTVSISSSDPSSGILQYYYTQLRVQVNSTSIQNLSFNENTVEVFGNCAVNGMTGYSYIVSIKYSDTDQFGIEVYHPDGGEFFKALLESVESGDFEVTVETLAHYQLTTAVEPVNSGYITPDCTEGCLLQSGSLAVLTANEYDGYAFNQWSGCDTSSDNICTINMDGDKNVMADFRACLFPVRIAGNEPVYYLLIQDAYDEAQDGDIIQIQNRNFSEDFSVNRDIEINLQGGFDCDFSEVIGITSIDGNLSISAGSVVIENIELR